MALQLWRTEELLPSMGGQTYNRDCRSTLAGPRVWHAACPTAAQHALAWHVPQELLKMMPALTPTVHGQTEYGRQVSQHRIGSKLRSAQTSLGD